MLCTSEPIRPKTIGELRALVVAAGIDPESIVSLGLSPDLRSRCALCGAPFLTVAAVLVCSATTDRRHFAHLDCAELELGRRFPKIKRSYIVLEAER